MIDLRFNDVTNNNCFPNGRHYTTDAVYQIDWNNGERRFKEPVYGVRVYEGGMVTVSCNTKRAPHLWGAYKRLGIDIRPARSWVDKTFYSPNGERVTKESIKNVYLMVDTNHKVALSLDRWGENGAIVYPTPGAIPYGRVHVASRRRNKQREKEVLAKLDDWVKYSVTKQAVGGFEHVWGAGAWAMGEFLKEVSQGRWDGSRPEESILCRFASSIWWRDRILFDVCCDLIEYPYLNVE